MVVKLYNNFRCLFGIFQISVQAQNLAWHRAKIMSKILKVRINCNRDSFFLDVYIAAHWLGAVVFEAGGQNSKEAGVYYNSVSGKRWSNLLIKWSILATLQAENWLIYFSPQRRWSCKKKWDSDIYWPSDGRLYKTHCINSNPYRYLLSFTCSPPTIFLVSSTDQCQRTELFLGPVAKQSTTIHLLQIGSANAYASKASNHHLANEA